MAGKRTMKLASRGKRFGAACIDMVVPVFAYIVVMIVTRGAGLRQTTPYGYGFGDDFGGGFGYGYGYGYGYPYGMRVSGAAIAVMILLCLILIAYLVVQIVFFSKSKSIGKSMLGLQVVSSMDGKPLGFWRMMLRECIVKSADSPLLLGYIWVLIDDKNRAWHDKILDTYVVDLKESERLSNDRRREAARAAASRLERREPEVSAHAPEAQATQVREERAVAVQAPQNVTAAPEVMDQTSVATESEMAPEELVLTPEAQTNDTDGAGDEFELIPEEQADEVSKAGEEQGGFELIPEEPEQDKTVDLEMVPEKPVTEVKIPAELILSAGISDADEAASEGIADKPADEPVEEAAEEVNEAARI